METWVWIVIAAVVAAVLILVVAIASARSKKRRRDHSDHLQERFGPEYERTVSAEGRKEGERRLSTVEQEHDELDIKPLGPGARERYLEEWRQTEARFVNDPGDAARSADRIVVRVLEDRGYPTDVDTDDQAAHVAAEHPDVVERYRHGHEMLESDDGDHETENLRKAMIDFRVVFDELVVTEHETAQR
jgi:hypothetical protein